jgi:diguanylate cyclase (GGDEF)-like protein/PAS domain S-box-containing protein
MLTKKYFAFIETVLDHLQDGVYLVDSERRVVYWNRAAERVSGYAEADMLGSFCSDNRLMHIDSHGNQLCLRQCPLSETMIDGKSREEDLFLHHKDGHRVPVHVHVSALRDSNGAIIGAAEIFTDHTRQQSLAKENERLRNLALLDEVTELGNRRYAEEHLHVLLSEAQRYNWSLGVLVIDIDQFKEINDTHGHSIGDRTLRVVARALAGGLRSYDLICRWGEDEFVALVKHADIPLLRVVAEKLRMMVEHCSVPLEGKKLNVTVSIGGTVARSEDSSGSILVRLDDLLYQAKAGGRNRSVLS